MINWEFHPNNGISVFVWLRMDTFSFLYIMEELKNPKIVNEIPEFGFMELDEN